MNTSATLTKSVNNLKALAIICLALMTFSTFSATKPQSKSGKSSTKQMIRLKAFNTATPGLADETVIYFDSNATTDFDSQYDAIKLMNTAPELPNLYTINNNKNFSINGQPMPKDCTITVALGLQINDKGVYEIDATEILNFSSDIQISLIDMEKGITQNLREIAKYTFSYKTGAPEGRFFIKFAPVSISTGITKLVENNLFNISKAGNSLNVTSTNNTGELRLNIFNTNGEVIADTKITSNKNYELNLKNGAYIVRVISNNKAYTKKIIVNQ